MIVPLLSPIDDPMSNPKFFERLRFPLDVSPKLDGVRCLAVEGECWSRSSKLLPSSQVQREFSFLNWVDGELIAGAATDHGVFNRTQSHVMSKSKPGPLSYHVFDHIHPDWMDFTFTTRFDKLRRLMETPPPNHFLVEHERVNTLDELLEYESKQLELGYEGVMLRNPLARYKMGRATTRENIIFKLKRFTDAEGEITDFVELMVNQNEAFLDEQGKTKRSSAKDGKVPGGTLGTFIVRPLDGGEEIRVGRGALSATDMQEVWDNRAFYKGKILKYRTFAHGAKDRPRFARAVGFRDLMDM